MSGGFVAEARVRHKDGRWLNLETSGSAVESGDARAKWVVATSRDLSDRRRVEREAESAAIRFRKLQAVTDVLLKHVELDKLLPAELKRLTP